LGNEQGTLVQFKCKAVTAPGPGASGEATTTGASVSGCQIDRDEAGSFSLSIFGKRIRDDAIVTIGGKSPKKIKFRDADPADGTFTRIIVKKKFCELLPGAIVITNKDGSSSAPVVCAQRCTGQ
jgi:hypothetical protein